MTTGTLSWPLRPWLGKVSSLHALRVRCEVGCEVAVGRNGSFGNWTTNIPRTPPMDRKGMQQRSLDTCKNRACVHVMAAKGRCLAELESFREEANADPVQFESPLAIVMYPDPRLRLKNKRINLFDERLQQLVDEMFDVMYRTDGVGLSAPQVGINVQLMVYNPVGLKGEGEEYVLINPKIVKYSRNRAVLIEGCLSFPHIEARVERPLSVRVEAQDVRGKKFGISLKEWQARIFQHEYDHLEGVLYFDRMSEEVVKSIVPEFTKLEEDFERRTGQPAPERIFDHKLFGICQKSFAK